MAQRHKHILPLETEWDQTAWLAFDRLLETFTYMKTGGMGCVYLHPMSLLSVSLLLSSMRYLHPQKELGATGCCCRIKQWWEM